jgi:hypothetical protein
MNPYEHWQRKLIESHTRRNPIEFNCESRRKSTANGYIFYCVAYFRLSSLYIIIYVFFLCGNKYAFIYLFIYLIISDLFNVLSSVADPGSGAFLTPGSGMGKKSRSGSGMNISDHISESLETIFWVKIRKFFEPRSGIRDEKSSDPG